MPDDKQSNVRLGSLRGMIWIFLIVLIVLGIRAEMRKRPAPKPANTAAAGIEKPTTDVLNISRCGEVVSADYKNATELKQIEVVLQADCASGRIEVPKGTTGVSTCASAPVTGNWYFPGDPRFPVPFTDKACGGKYPDADQALKKSNDHTWGMPVAFDLQNPQNYKVKVTILLQRNPTW
ncbi:MAG: hypothetical protein Q8P49_01295 [Candidatus Liptonbacteria bacterium]|nr:hypothetical protein [Candidatus Liptonbacteria bacterium]